MPLREAPLCRQRWIYSLSYIVQDYFEISPGHVDGFDQDERSFALILNRGGMRRASQRGRDNVQKRYLIHVSGCKFGLIVRLLTGFGTPRRWAEARIAVIWPCYPINHQTTALFGCLVCRRTKSPHSARYRDRTTHTLTTHLCNGLLSRLPMNHANTLL